MAPKKKGRVRAHTRKTKKGRVTNVREHDRAFRIKYAAAAKKLKGKRKGQTKSFHGKTHYVKAGKIHKYDLDKDAEIHADHKRSKNAPTWRGDRLPRSRI